MPTPKSRPPETRKQRPLDKGGTQGGLGLTTRWGVLIQENTPRSRRCRFATAVASGALSHTLRRRGSQRSSQADAQLEDRDPDIVGKDAIKLLSC